MKSVLSAVAALTLPCVCAGERPLLDALPQNAVQSAFQVLRRDYIHREDLSYEELNRAALQGLLERLDFGAALVPSAAPEKAAQPVVHSEFLAPDTAYLRPETFGEGEGAMFEKALAGIVEKKAANLILDLRAAAGGLFDEASLMLQCFLPQGDLMFKMKQLNSEEAELFISKRSPLWSGRIVVLIDGETGSAAEIVAAVLQSHGRAFLVGSKTRGATVRYSVVKLSEDTTLRYASAEMLLPDGASFFKKGLAPHFPVVADMEEKQQAFAGSRGKSQEPFIADRVRSRFNERALVKSQNPEIDDYVRRSAGQPLPGDAGQIRDVVTQRAVDLIQGGEFHSKTRLNWEVKAEGTEPQPTEDIPKALPADPAKP